MNLKLALLADTFSVSRLAHDAPVPAWATTAPVFSVTRTADELSIVAPESITPADVHAERGWRALKLEGPFDFALTGVLASVLQPLAESRVSIFAISTFDTDYVLVRSETLDAATSALRAAGHRIA